MNRRTLPFRAVTARQRYRIAAVIAIASACTQAHAQTQPQALLNQYCVTCHNEKLKTGGLALDKLDFDHVGPNAETWEKVVRKVRAGMMPPAGARRPDRKALDAFAGALEGIADHRQPRPIPTPAAHRCIA